MFGCAIGAGELAYIDFLTPGILAAGTMFAATQTAVGVAQERTGGFVDGALTLPTSRLGLVLGRVMADALVTTGAAATILAAATVIGFRHQATVVQLVAAAGLLIAFAVTCSALFVALGSYASNPQSAQTFGYLAIPPTFISSAYVPTDSMPSWMAFLADHQPVTHVVDGLRALLHGQTFGSDAGRLATALAWLTVISVISLVLARRRLSAS